MNAPPLRTAAPLADQAIPIRVGARGSPLSVAQSRWLRTQAAMALGLDGETTDTALPFTAITTTGDRIQDRTLAEAGGKGLFTRELDEALLDGRIDCAIHSLKDVPTVLPDGVVLLPFPPREDPRDALITRDGRTLEELPQGAHIGTASLRRAAQLRHARPDLKVSPLRGNVGTRIARLEEGLFDATVLALSGMRRLGVDSQPHSLLDPQAMPPAIGQGALAVTARAGDEGVAAVFARLAPPQTQIALAAERAFLAALDGSCRTATGAYCRFDADGALHIVVEALSGDGTHRFRRTATLPGPTEVQAADTGRSLGAQIRAEAGSALDWDH
jgi:hydroxymethylbilane synthase